ncbi:alpha/beta hydrolase [Agromyces sp. LHK192]|uniref:alpha/beta hydrolase n=1 Tax=Agromyces sp. LHK192 TaxID=2498704 RepID=UPI00196AF3EE|nr:alpha/beta fold hydrolase [Agromyces sp. LHK192]
MSETAPIEIRAAVELPASREDIELRTDDGLTLVGELATPVDRPPVATLVTLHPLPTHGGFMDSHILRKAAARLPALAGLAVLRFNTRGTTSPRGTSGGEFGDGVTERADVAAAMAFVRERGLPAPWLVGWSFGTELALKYGLEHEVAGVILLSPPLRRTTPDEVARWAGASVPVVALVPEHDDFLQPAAAAAQFAVAPNIRVVGVDDAKHLWVGEQQTRRVLDEIVGLVAPDALPLPTTWPVA